MNGRERVKAALNFSAPDRAPRDIWVLPYVPLYRKDEYDVLVQKYPSDIGASQLNPGANNESLASMSEAGHYTDEWGSVWSVGEAGVIGEVKQPVLSDWSGLKQFQPPWSMLRGRDLSHLNKSCENSTQFMLSPVSARPFERLQFLRGAENLYLDLAEDSREFHKLLEMVHEFYVEDVKSWCASNVDGVFMMDDWGANQSLLINPEVWREVFKPLYKEYCDIIHSNGKYAFFHSDGNIEAIYGDLIDIGFDAINSQLFRMNIERLAELYKGKVTFWGEIDRQQVLPFGNPQDVRAAVRRVRAALDDGTGGVIAQCEWGKDNSLENIETVFKAWME